jgi:hypothetical protein
MLAHLNHHTKIEKYFLASNLQTSFAETDNSLVRRDRQTTTKQPSEPIIIQSF